jgi:hypothetical protein
MKSDGDRGSQTYKRGNLTIRGAALLAEWRTPKAGETMGRYSRVNGKDYPGLFQQADMVEAPYPTPVAGDDNKTPEAHLAMKKRMGERDGTGANRTAITSLAVLAQYTGWPTPQAFDASSDGLPKEPRYKGNAPSEQGNTRDPNKPGSYRADLKDIAGLATWPTPRAEEREQHNSRDNYVALSLQAKAVQQGDSGPTANGSPTETGAKGRLNPELSRWLMGFPKGWSYYADTATRSSRKSRPRS